MTDSVQILVGSWWTGCEPHPVKRGQLIHAFVPHVDQQPYTIVEEARLDPTEHGKATFKIGPAPIQDARKKATLPVAAMPVYEGEVRTVHRAKVRPCLIISLGGTEIDKALRPSTSARWSSAPTFLVAPYYGVEKTGQRGGWHPPLVERIRACEYPQYILDALPIGGGSESILRLDHIQPVGHHHTSLKPLPHRLTDDALAVVDEWIAWLVTERLEEKGVLRAARELLLSPAIP